MFTTLAHHLGEAFLTEALHQLRKAAAAGMDEMTAAEYSQRTVFIRESYNVAYNALRRVTATASASRSRKA